MLEEKALPTTLSNVETISVCLNFTKIRDDSPFKILLGKLASSTISSIPAFDSDLNVVIKVSASGYNLYQEI